MKIQPINVPKVWGMLKLLHIPILNLRREKKKTLDRTDSLALACGLVAAASNDSLLSPNHIR